MRALKAARLQDLPLSAEGQLAGIIHAIVIAATEVDVELLEKDPTTLDYPQPIRGAVRNACEALSIVSVGSLLAHFQDRDASKRLQEALGTRARLLQVEACLKRAMAEADGVAQAPTPPRKSPADEAAASVALDGDTRSINDLVMPTPPPESVTRVATWPKTREKMNAVLSAVARGDSVIEAAKAGDTHKSVIEKWRQGHPLFLELYNTAKQLGAATRSKPERADPRPGPSKKRPAKTQQEVAKPDTDTGIPDTPAQDVVGKVDAHEPPAAEPQDQGTATIAALTSKLREKQRKIDLLAKQAVEYKLDYDVASQKIQNVLQANEDLKRRAGAASVALQEQQDENLQLRAALSRLSKHPTIEGLFELLPPAGNAFSIEKRLAWLRAIAAVFEVAYGGSHGRHITIDSYRVVQEVL